MNSTQKNDRPIEDYIRSLPEGQQRDIHELMRMILEIRHLETAMWGDSIKHGVGGSGVEMAGLFERQNAFHPAVALGARRPQGPLPPQDAKPQGSLGPVVGGLDAVVFLARHKRVAVWRKACILLQA